MGAVDEPGLIETASPSSINALRKCGLAVYRRRSRQQGRGRGPQNPLARLGTAAHNVLEWIANNAHDCVSDPQLEESIRQRWSEATETQERSARDQRLERANGTVSRWPRFAQIQEDLVVDGIALAQELAPLPQEKILAEHEVTNTRGDLAGSIDLLLLGDDNTATVIDHKVGAVTPDDTESGGRYSTQLLLYASLVRDLGYEPTAAEIRPLGRKPIPIEVSSQAIDVANESGQRDVAAYNDRVLAGHTIQLARPAEETCQWCEFLLDCGAVWIENQPNLGELEVLEGTLQAIETAASGAMAFRIDSKDGSVTVTGLSPARVPTLQDFGPGDEVRIVGLSRTSPGRYRPRGGRLDAAKLEALTRGDEQSD